MRRDRRYARAANRSRQLRERRDASQREPVFVQLGDTRLLADAARKISQRESLRQQLVLGDASRERDRLEADPRNRVDVLDRHAHDVADLVIVETLDDRRNEDNLHARRAAVLDDLHLSLEQRLPARAAIHVVSDTIELQVERVQSRCLRLLRELQISKRDSIRRGLNVGKSHVPRHGENFEKLRMDRRLAARELHHAAIDWALAAQRLQHHAHLLDIRLIQITCNVGVRETHWAGQVTAVGEVNIGQSSMRSVHAAKPTIVRTRLRAFDLRVRQPEIVAEIPLLHLQVEPGIAEHNVAKLAVVRTRLLHHDLAVLLDYSGGNDLRTFRAQRLRGFRESAMEWPDRSAGVGYFGLQNAQAGPLAGNQNRDTDFGRQRLCAHSTSPRELRSRTIRMKLETCRGTTRPASHYNSGPTASSRAVSQRTSIREAPVQRTA